MFGCGAYQLIPNDPLDKVPGLMKGPNVIFVGFKNGCNGFRVFDPELRTYNSMKVLSIAWMRFGTLIHEEKR